ncbi:MAG: hypothetical protein AAF702_16405 [Chloroflexota bacterium]
MKQDLVTKDNLVDPTDSVPSLNQLDLPQPSSPGDVESSRRPPFRKERTDGVTILALYHLAWAAIFFIGASIMAIPTIITAIIGLTDDPDIFFATGILGIVAFLIFALSIVHFFVTVGLWTLREWARIVAIALGAISLPTVLGTIPGALTIWYLMKEEVAELFR